MVDTNLETRPQAFFPDTVDDTGEFVLPKVEESEEPNSVPAFIPGTFGESVFEAISPEPLPKVKEIEEIYESLHPAVNNAFVTSTPVPTEKLRPKVSESLSLENAARLFEQDVENEKPFSHITFLYDYYDYGQFGNVSPDMVGAIREVESELKVLATLYGGKIDQELVTTLTTVEGWNELLEKGRIASGVESFGEKMRVFMMKRGNELAREAKTLNLSKEKAINLEREAESHFKTARILGSEINNIRK